MELSPASAPPQIFNMELIEKKYLFVCVCGWVGVGDQRHIHKQARILINKSRKGLKMYWDSLWCWQKCTLARLDIYLNVSLPPYNIFNLKSQTPHPPNPPSETAND